MFPVDDLVQVAEDLRKHSVDAHYTILYGPRGAIEGLEVGNEFFPLWELRLPENQAALQALDLARIRACRKPDWTPEPPRLARGAAV